MVETTFCYEIHEDYGLARNIETGNNAKAYTSVVLHLKEELTEEQYKEFHEKGIVQMLVQQIKIDEKFIKPISLEKYFEEMEEE